MFLYLPSASARSVYPSVNNDSWAPDMFNKPQTKSAVIKSLISVNEYINSRSSV